MRSCNEKLSNQSGTISSSLLQQFVSIFESPLLLKIAAIFYLILVWPKQMLNCCKSNVECSKTIANSIENCYWHFSALCSMYSTRAIKVFLFAGDFPCRMPSWFSRFNLGLFWKFSILCWLRIVHRCRIVRKRRFYNAHNIFVHHGRFYRSKYGMWRFCLRIDELYR